jgi:hypothetical protein
MPPRTQDPPPSAPGPKSCIQTNFGPIYIASIAGNSAYAWVLIRRNFVKSPPVQIAVNLGLPLTSYIYRLNIIGQYIINIALLRDLTKFRRLGTHMQSCLRRSVPRRGPCRLNLSIQIVVYQLT